MKNLLSALFVFTLCLSLPPSAFAQDLPGEKTPTTMEVLKKALVDANLAINPKVVEEFAFYAAKNAKNVERHHYLTQNLDDFSFSESSASPTTYEELLEVLNLPRPGDIRDYRAYAFVHAVIADCTGSDLLNTTAREKQESSNNGLAVSNKANPNAGARGFAQLTKEGAIGSLEDKLGNLFKLQEVGVTDLHDDKRVIAENEKLFCIQKKLNVLPELKNWQFTPFWEKSCFQQAYEDNKSMTLREFVVDTRLWWNACEKEFFKFPDNLVYGGLLNWKNRMRAGRDLRSSGLTTSTPGEKPSLEETREYIVNNANFRYNGDLNLAAAPDLKEMFTSTPVGLMTRFEKEFQEDYPDMSYKEASQKDNFKDFIEKKAGPAINEELAKIMAPYFFDLKFKSKVIPVKITFNEENNELKAYLEYESGESELLFDFASIPEGIKRFVADGASLARVRHYLTAEEEQMVSSIADPYTKGYPEQARNEFVRKVKENRRELALKLLEKFSPEELGPYIHDPQKYTKDYDYLYPHYHPMFFNSFISSVDFSELNVPERAVVEKQAADLSAAFVDSIRSSDMLHAALQKCLTPGKEKAYLAAKEFQKNQTLWEKIFKSDRTIKEIASTKDFSATAYGKLLENTFNKMVLHQLKEKNGQTDLVAKLESPVFKDLPEPMHYTAAKQNSASKEIAAAKFSSIEPLSPQCVNDTVKPALEGLIASLQRKWEELPAEKLTTNSGLVSPVASCPANKPAPVNEVVPFTELLGISPSALEGLLKQEEERAASVGRD